MIPGEKRGTAHLCPKARLPRCNGRAAAQASICLASQGPLTQAGTLVCSIAAAHLPSTSSPSAGGQVGNQPSGLAGGCTGPLVLSSSSCATGVQPLYPEQCSIHHARCHPRPFFINTGSAHVEPSELIPHTLVADPRILAGQV